MLLGGLVCVLLFVIANFIAQIIDNQHKMINLMQEPVTLIIEE